MTRVLDLPRRSAAMLLLRQLATDWYALLGLVSISLGSSLWIAAFLTWNT